MASDPTSPPRLHLQERGTRERPLSRTHLPSSLPPFSFLKKLPTNSPVTGLPAGIRISAQFQSKQPSATSSSKSSNSTISRHKPASLEQKPQSLTPAPRERSSNAGTLGRSAPQHPVYSCSLIFTIFPPCTKRRRSGSHSNKYSPCFFWPLS